MSDIEKEIFLYGYWKNTFYDSNKKVQRRWKGINLFNKKIKIILTTGNFAIKINIHLLQLIILIMVLVSYFLT